MGSVNIIVIPKTSHMQHAKSKKSWYYVL